MNERLLSIYWGECLKGRRDWSVLSELLLGFISLARLEQDGLEDAVFLYELCRRRAWGYWVEAGSAKQRKQDYVFNE